MVERFPDEFVTWRHKTLVGIKVDEVFGMDSKNGKVWVEMAKQIYSELGEPNYRIIEHFSNGAPRLDNYPGRISLTHTSHFLAVASLPKTPEVNIDCFNSRTAMGIDAEPLDRAQVVKVRNKFLSEKELDLIPENNLQDNILAWTSKEALYKAAFIEPLDFRNALEILKLPTLQDDPVNGSLDKLGEAMIHFPEDSNMDSQVMKLFSYSSYDCCVTIAFSPKCARFGK